MTSCCHPTRHCLYLIVASLFAPATSLSSVAAVVVAIIVLIVVVARRAVDFLSEIASCASCAAMTYQMKIQPCAFWMKATIDHLEVHRFLQ